MERGLESALKWAETGSFAPQFAGSWEASLEWARGIVKEVEDISSARVRLAVGKMLPEAFCALLRAAAGANVDLFFFDPRWSERERSNALDLVKPNALVQKSDEGSYALEILQREAPVSEAEHAGPRFMIATGGTGGRIRFAIHDWASVLASARGFMDFFCVKSVSTHCVLPLHHVSGFMQVIRSWLGQGFTVFGSLQSFEDDHAELLDNTLEAPFLSLVSTHLERLLKQEALLSCLRRYAAIFIGGGPCSEELLRKGQELGLPLAPTYGMTETAAQVATLKPEAFLKGARGQGDVLPHVELNIVDAGSGKELPKGEEGRISISGQSLFYGYYGQQARERSFFLTDDTGHLDECGCLHVGKRLGRVLISGGEKINLDEIEEIAMGSGLLKDAVAFSLDDEEWNESLALAYVSKNAATEDTHIKERISRLLAGYKAPKIWLRLSALPRNEAGKVALGKLRGRASKSE